MTNDEARPAATVPDSDFSLSIDEALERYARAGLPRTPRSIQRYCAKGDLVCRLVETPIGQKYLITPESVNKHIAYIEEIVANSRAISRPVGTPSHEKNSVIEPIVAAATIHDASRPVATGPDVSRYIGRLEGENSFLRSQVEKKDEQISALLERDKETNTLIHRLQAMLAPLLVSPADKRPNDRADRSGN